MANIKGSSFQRGANASTVVVQKGMGPLSVLGIIFVLCKIFSIGPIAAWSWWWVLLPFYAGIAIVLAIWAVILAVLVVGAIGLGLVFCGAWGLDRWNARKRRKAFNTKFR